MQHLLSVWLRAVGRVVRPRLFADQAEPSSTAPKLPRIEDVVARTGRTPPVAD